MDREQILERIEGLENGDYTSHKAFDEHLDESFTGWEIAGMHYEASGLLKAVDPVAYRCFFNDWADGEITELREELMRLPDEDPEVES